MPRGRASQLSPLHVTLQSDSSYLLNITERSRTSIFAFLLFRSFHGPVGVIATVAQAIDQLHCNDCPVHAINRLCDNGCPCNGCMLLSLLKLGGASVDADGSFLTAEMIHWKPQEIRMSCCSRRRIIVDVTITKFSLRVFNTQPLCLP